MENKTKMRSILSIVIFIFSLLLAFNASVYRYTREVDFTPLLFGVMGIILLAFHLALFSNKVARKLNLIGAIVLVFTPLMIGMFGHNKIHDFYIQRIKPVSFCSLESGTYRKDKCLEYLAKKRNDIEICKKKTSGYYDGCVHGMAEKNKNEDLCTLKTQHQYFCFRSLAIEKKDVDICLMVDDANQSDPGQDECFFSFALTFDDINICERIKNASKRLECETSYYPNPQY
jgi:hypothetical protein